MSAITEYVHFYKEHYYEWGINRVGTTKSGSLEESFSQIRNRLGSGQIAKAKQLRQQAQKLQTAYNRLFFPKKETKFSDRFSKVFKDTVQEVLDEQFGIAAGKFNVQNFDVEPTALSGELQKAIEEVKKDIEIERLQKKAMARTALSRVSQLAEVLLRLDEKVTNETIKQELEKAKKELNQIKKRLEPWLGKRKPDIPNDIETINKFIQKFNRSFLWSNQRGDLFEWLLPLIKIKSSKLAGEELKKEIKRIIGSKNMGNENVKIEVFDFLKMSSKELSMSLDAEEMKMRTVEARSKTDVFIDYKIGENQYKDIPVSAKSVIENSVKLVDSASLYRILMFSQNYNFIKHYLNVVSKSKKGGQSPEAQIIQANRLVKKLIMQLAAQGYDLNNPSELLIVHNVKEKQIKVYNIKALIFLIQEQIGNGNSKYDNLIKSEKGDFSDTFTIDQRFEDTVEERLTSLFNQINKVKVTAHIYGPQLNQYFSKNFGL